MARQAVANNWRDILFTVYLFIVVSLCVCADADVLNCIRANSANVVKGSTATVPQLVKYPYKFSTFTPESMGVLIEQLADGQSSFGGDFSGHGLHAEWSSANNFWEATPLQGR